RCGGTASASSTARTWWTCPTDRHGGEMRKVMVGGLIPLLAFGLACGGSLGGGAPDLADLEGRFCSEDPEVGCYRFEGNLVFEEDVKLRGGTKLGEDGTWELQSGLLLMRFPTGTWTLEPVTYTGDILILHDPDQNDTFTFIRAE